MSQPGEDPSRDPRHDAGDVAGLDRLIDAHGDFLARTAFAVLGDHHAAEEAVQDTLLAAWTGAGSIRAGTDIRCWLMGVLMNQCRKQQRSWTRWLRRHAGWRPPVQAPPDPRLAVLQSALAELPDETRAVIVLRYLNQMPVDACAEILGIPPGTVKSRCHHALARLRERIPDLLEESHGR